MSIGEKMTVEARVFFIVFGLLLHVIGSRAFIMMTLPRKQKSIFAIIMAIGTIMFIVGIYPYIMV